VRRAGREPYPAGAGGTADPHGDPGSGRAPAPDTKDPGTKDPAVATPPSPRPAPDFAPPRPARRHLGRRAVDVAGDLKDACAAEWTKFRTVPGTWALTVAIVVLTVGLGAGAVAAVGHSAGADQDMVRTSLTGVSLGQAVVAVLAVTVITGEYGGGMIRTTFAAMPRRQTVLAAKAAVLTAAVLAAATVAVAGSLVVGRLLLPGHGGHPPFGLADASTLRAAVGSVLYLALIALLSLGVATAVRDAGAATGAVLGLLYLFPVVAGMVTDPHWQRHLQQAGPMTAGLAVQTTTASGLDSLPIGPWPGLGVAAAWAVAALTGAAWLLRVRDA